MAFYVRFYCTFTLYVQRFEMSFYLFQGYEGSLLKVTSKNGKTASVIISTFRLGSNTKLSRIIKISCCFQPVGFVTFHTRAGAEAAKQDLQVCLTVIILQ